MSGITKGGNYIVQSCLTDAEVRPLPGVTYQCSICGAEYADGAVAKECYEECLKGFPMPPVTDTPVAADVQAPRVRPSPEVRNLLQIANRTGRDFPMPPMTFNDENIDVHAVLHDLLNAGETGLEAQEDMAPDAGTTGECQVPIGSDDVCGLSMRSPIHDFGNPNGHPYMPTPNNAGVAQSAEQGFRKAEVVGSTPISSSMKLNKEQVDALKLIVHYRLQLEDLRKAVSDAETALNTTKRATADAQRTYDTTVKRAERQGKEFEGLLYDAEASLRRLIVEDVLIKGTPEPAPEPAKPVEIEEHDDLGRAE